MDLVTFYALYAIGSAPPRAYNSLRFPSMEACELFTERMVERKPEGYTVIDYACVADGAKLPHWAPDGRIYGVPLLPQDMQR